MHIPPSDLPPYKSLKTYFFDLSSLSSCKFFSFSLSAIFLALSSASFFSRNFLTFTLSFPFSFFSFLTGSNFVLRNVGRASFLSFVKNHVSALLLSLFNITSFYLLPSNAITRWTKIVMEKGYTYCYFYITSCNLLQE